MFLFKRLAGTIKRTCHRWFALNKKRLQNLKVIRYFVPAPSVVATYYVKSLLSFGQFPMQWLLKMWRNLNLANIFENCQRFSSHRGSDLGTPSSLIVDLWRFSCWRHLLQFIIHHLGRIFLNFVLSYSLLMVGTLAKLLTASILYNAFKERC